VRTLLHGFELGIVLGGGGTPANGLVQRVTVTNNTRIGIELSSSDNVVRDNVADSDSVGIFADFGAIGNTITGNSAHSNALDLVDSNAHCGTNVWLNNSFGTANQTCIH